jgi:hypothetical protein
MLNAAENIRFSGFANLGLTYSDSEQLEFRNTILNNSHDGLTFAADSLLGLQVNAKLSDKFDAVGQVVLQDRRDRSATNYVQLAFLRYQVNRNLSFKAGRFSTPSYLFTDYRYVGHALTWVRPPVEMYSVVGAIGNMDGLQSNYVTDADFGVIKLGLSYGSTEYEKDGQLGNFRFTYKDLTGVNLELQATNWRAQAVMITGIYDDITFPGIVETRATVDLVPTIFKPLAQDVVKQFIPEGTRVTYISLGGTYDYQGIEFVGEIAEYKSEWALASDAVFGYLSASYNVENFTPYMTLGFQNRGNKPEVIDYDATQQTLPPFLFQQLEALLATSNEFVRGTSIDQKSISLGLKWDFSDSWSFKTQFDHFKISEYGSRLFEVKAGLLTPAQKLHYNVLNISFTTTF